MKKLVTWMMGCAFALATVVGVTFAADKGKDVKAGEAVSKVVLENDKVRVLETTWKPGDQSASVARGGRVFRALKGGSLTRIYPDGKKEVVSFKDGEVRWVDATPPYALKNEGKSTIMLYTVYPK
jgi:hypothetical protein